MALWFLDLTNGDDANDGRQAESAPLSVAGEITDADVALIFLANADAAALTVGDIRYFSSASLSTAGWYQFEEILAVGGAESKCRFTNLDGDAVASCSDLAAASTGPFKTLAQLQSVAVAGDTGYQVSPTGVLMQVYPDADPVSEVVAKALKAKLETITIANGYTLTVGEVLRPAALYVPIPADMQVVMQQAADRIAEETSTMFETHKLELHLFLMRRISEDEVTPTDTYANRFAAAVRKCLLSDLTLGGVAIDSAVGDLETVESSEAISGYDLGVVVTYRHADDDPYPA